MASFSLESFCAHLTRGMAEFEAGVAAGLSAAGELIEREAKAELGTYQSGAGPFPAWEELHDYTKEDRVAKGFTENDPGLRSGEMRDSIGHTVTADSVHIGSDADELLWFEMGTDTQSPRSVLGLAMARHGKEASEIVAGAATAALFKR